MRFSFLITACVFLLASCNLPWISTSQRNLESSKSTSVSPNKNSSATKTVFPSSTELSPTAVVSPSPLPEIIALPSPTKKENANRTQATWVSPHIGAEYRTPPTIMLHESHEGFDAPKFLQEMLNAANQRGMQTVTYAQIENDPELLNNGSGDLLIITIDDISLQSKLDPSIQEMISILLESKSVAVLGVTTEGDYVNPETSQTLRELISKGWQIASHGDAHRNLLEIESESPGEVKHDIRNSKEKILSATGVDTNVLILPYGQMVNDARLLYKVGIKWAVGISGGSTLDIKDRIIYVGRQAPAGSGEETLELMLRPFESGN